jgi:hypothetical protein
MLPCGAPLRLAGPHGDFLRFAVCQGEFDETVSKKNGNRIGMLVQNGLLFRTICDAKDAHLLVLKCHFVVLRIDLRGVLCDRSAHRKCEHRAGNQNGGDVVSDTLQGFLPKLTLQTNRLDAIPRRTPKLLESGTD